MRNLSIFYLIVLFNVLTINCGGVSSGSQFPLVERVWIAPISLETGWYAKPGAPFYIEGVSPDGRFIYSSSGYQANIETGETQLVFPVSFDSFVMSPSGQYISGISGAFVRPLYDAGKKDFVSDKSYYGPITDFSPDSTRATNIYYPKDIITIPEENPVSNWPMEVDFRQSEHTGGSGNLLWDTDLNIPVAKLNLCGIECNNNVLLYSIPADLESALGQYSQKIYQVPSPNKLSGSAFSPDGQYVLLVIWERTAVPLNDQSPSFDFVRDSILVLVNWRTGASKEIFRLSNIASDYAIASGKILWSANGEVVVVQRYKAVPLIIKLNYPR